MLMFVVVFFFCKQKTAYEMRISDWSSDVCSSDLPSDMARSRAIAARCAQVMGDGDAFVRHETALRAMVLDGMSAQARAEAEAVLADDDSSPVPAERRRNGLRRR